MALVKLEKIDNNSAWALWKVEESFEELKRLYGPTVTDSGELEEISHLEKRAEWLAGRLSAKALVEKLNQPFNGIYKDAYGKPYLHGINYHISLANSYPYAGAIVHQEKYVGIDIEEPKETLIRIKHKFLNAVELEKVESDLGKLCMYWCAKECLYKIYGKKQLSFRENIFIDNLSLESGRLSGYTSIHGSTVHYQLHVKNLFNYYLVYGF